MGNKCMNAGKNQVIEQLEDKKLRKKHLKNI
jgi:hypothetical protein